MQDCNTVGKKYKTKAEFKKSKTYKKRMSGPVHRKLKAWYGMEPFYENGKIKTSFLKRGKGRAQREFTAHPTAANRLVLRQFTEALNFRSKYKVTGTGR